MKAHVEFTDLIEGKIEQAATMKLNYLIGEVLSEPDAGERALIVKVKIKPKGDGERVILKVEIDKAEPKDPKEEFVRMLDMTGQGELFPVVKDGSR